eukprot:14170017-Ditylum_brightwellii.AAC.1
MDNDSRGLGHWGFVKLVGKNQKEITIVTAYQPCKQNKPSDATVNAQQHRLLRQQGIQHPQPHTQWLKDLLPLLQTWKREGEAFLMVDANSSLDDKAFAPFIAEAGLCDVIGAAHGIDSPNSHAEG